jgi:hypothetical protein
MGDDANVFASSAHSVPGALIAESMRSFQARSDKVWSAVVREQTP